MADLVNGLGGSTGFGEDKLESFYGSRVFDLSTIFGYDLVWEDQTWSTLYLFGSGFYFYTDDYSNRLEISPLLSFSGEIGLEGATIPSPGGTSTGSNEIYIDFDESTKTLTVTWDDIHPYDGDTTAQNAYQIRIIGRGTGDFDIELRYENLEIPLDELGFRAAYFLLGSTFHTGFLDSSELVNFVGTNNEPGYLRFTVRSGVIDTDFDRNALPPSTVSDQITLVGFEPVTIDVLANDFPNAQSFDLSSLRIIYQPQFAEAQVLPNGLIELKPVAQFDTRYDYLYYEVTADDGQTSIGYAEIIYPTQAFDDTAVTIAGSPISIPVVVNESDSPYFFGYLEIVDLPANGNVHIEDGGLVTYAPNPAFTGTDTFSYRSFDGFGGASVPATVTVDILPELPNAGLVTGLGGEAGFGESSLYPNVSEALNIDLTQVFENGLNFFGRVYDYLVIDDDGVVYFDDDQWSNYEGNVINFSPAFHLNEAPRPLIAPFLMDIDTGSGQRPVSSPGGTSTGSNRVYYDLDPASDTLTITWDDVGYYYPGSDDGGATHLANAFQLQLINASSTDGRAPGDFDIVFRYEWIDWTIDWRNGGLLGRALSENQIVAQAGIALGNGGVPFEVPGSGSQDGLLALPFTVGNTGEVGVWRYEVRNAPNEKPVGTSDLYSVFRGSTLTINVADGLLANDSDAEDDSLTAVLLSEPSYYGNLELNADGSFFYVSNAGFVGTDTFTYRAFDGTDFSDPVTVEIAVKSANEDTYTTLNDQVITVDALSGVLANDIGLEGDSFTAVLDSLPERGDLNLNSDGSFTYTPNQGFAGVDTFTYRAFDGASYSPPTSVSITSTSLQINDLEISEKNEGSQDAVFTARLSYPAQSNLYFNYQTVDGSATAGEDYLPTSGTLIIQAEQTEATINVTVHGDYALEPDESFVLSITPQGGGEAVDAIATIISDDFQNPPTAVGDLYTVLSGSMLNTDASTGVLSNDADIEGDFLTALQVDAPSHGNLNFNADGSFSYTSDEVFIGTDTFTYRAFDGVSYSLPTSVSITTTSFQVNNPEITEGNTGSQEAVFRVQLPIPTTSNLVFDYQTIDGTAIAGEDYIATSGNLTILAGQSEATVSVTVNGDFDQESDETFMLAITPQVGGETIKATATIIADDFQNPPITVEDFYTVESGSTLNTNASTGVLANDSDSEGDALSALLVNAPSHGAFGLNEDGSFSYTPNPGYVGTDTFTYRASDGIGVSADTAVQITVRSPATGPEPVPVGSPRKINVFDEGDQITPSVTALSNGAFAVIWVSRGQDGSGDGVYGRIVDANGSPISEEFQINTTTIGDQQAPRIAALEGGGFVVVWDSFGQDGDKDAVIARRFANDGAPAGEEVLVNEASASWQVAPDVIGLRDGGFAVVWQSEHHDGSFAGVYGRIFGAHAVPQTGEFRLNEETTGYQSFPRIAQLEDGRLVAVWESEGQDGDGDGVFARIFETDGVADGGEFQINNYVPSYQSRPDVGALANGGFAIAWQSYGQDGDRNGVYTRVFDAEGNASNTEVQVAQNVRSDQVGATITTVADGTYFVSYEDHGVYGGSQQGFTGRFDLNGDANGITTAITPFSQAIEVADVDLAIQRNGHVAPVYSQSFDSSFDVSIYPVVIHIDSIPETTEIPSNLAEFNISYFAESSTERSVPAFTQTTNSEFNDQHQYNASGDSTHCINSINDPGLDVTEPNAFLSRREALDIAEFSYRKGGGSIPEGYEELESIEGEEFGFYADVLHNEEANEVIVAFRGTEVSFGDLRDVRTDAGFGIAQWNESGQDILNILRDLNTRSAPDNPLKVSFIGHSLGGALAQFAAYDAVDFLTPELIDLTTFNSLGGGTGIKIRDGSLDEQRLLGVQVNHYAHIDDLVVKFGESHLGGDVKRLSPASEILYFAGTAHGFDALREVIGEDPTGLALDYFSVDNQALLVAALMNDPNLTPLLENLGTADKIALLDKLVGGAVTSQSALDALVNGAVNLGAVAFQETISLLATALAEAIDPRIGPQYSVDQLRNLIFAAEALDHLDPDCYRDEIDRSREDAIKLVKDNTGPGDGPKSARNQFEGSKRPTDPIILDLCTDGLKLINVSDSSARFDLDADGFAERTGWVSPDDAFLIYDRNNDGIVNDISEFFGSGTVDGFAELDGFDTNRDGVIAADEPIWEKLKLWRDLDGDGNTDAGELVSLESQGITTLSVDVTEVNYRIEGNFVPYISTYQGPEIEGLTGAAFFQLDQFDSTFDGSSTFAEEYTLDPETLLLPFLRGYGNVPDLYIEMSINPDLKDLVIEFTQLGPEDHGRVMELAEDIVLLWARVDDVQADSRGPHFDGQKLAALETFFGENYAVMTRGGTLVSNDPTTEFRGQQLQTSWDLLFRGYLCNLLIQTDFANAFNGVVYDIVTDAPLLVGSIFEVISELVDDTPISTLEAIEYWNLVGPIVEKLGGQTDLTKSELHSLVNDALQNAGLPFSLTALVNAQIATGEEGASISGTENDDLFVGTLASENFFGGQGGDVFILSDPNWGQDSIVEITTRSDESRDDVIVLPEGITLNDITLERIPNDFILRRIGTDDEVIVQTVDLLGADGDFGVEILRFSDGSEVQVAALLGEMTISAGEDAVVNEGGTFTRRVEISDPVDEDGEGWTYQVTWSDGISNQDNVAAGETGFDITREFADDIGTLSVEVSVADGLIYSDSDRFDVNVVNVAPTIALSGPAEVDEGVGYILNLGAVTDPGDDTVTSYIVNWGDGSSDTYTIGGDVAHTFAADGNYTISVDLVDEDGTHVAAGTLAIVVNDVTVLEGISVNMGGDSSINEGTTFSRTITFTDGEDNNSDGWIYSVDWGDGSNVEHGVIAAGANSFEINRVFADGDAGHNVSVTVTDMAGDSDTQQFQLNVNNIAPTVTLLGADTVHAGVSYTLNLGAITDPGQDTVTSYIVNWGDGSSETFSSAGDVTHIYATAGNTTITVDLVDEDGTHINAGSLAVAVSMPSAGVSLDVGENAALNEGSLFTRTITFSDGEDAGGDGWTYSVDWGDGSAVENGVIAAGANTFDISRFFADGDASHTVSITVTDTAGDTDTRQFVLGVNNVAPAITLIGNTSVDEGSVYTLTGSVIDPGMDRITSYIINWGDGTTTTLTAAEVQALSGNVTHVFADGASNPLISVDLVDEDGTHAAAGTLSVTVNNVAPTIALSGTAEVNAGDSYMLNLGAITDPGDDTVTNYIVNWGDGNVETFSAAGDVTHVYAATGSNTISVDLVDEDGTHTNAGSLVVMINDIVSVETVRIGDAPARITNLSQLVDAWSDPLLGNITHKSNATNLAEAWSTVALTTLNSLVLPGGDLYAGDLGVSGRSVATSTIAQELDGTETLRFEFTEEATAITVSLSRFYSDDLGSVFNESGRIRLLDSNGNVVGETTFVADALNGQRTLSLASETKFTAVEFNAGAYDGDLFIYGALADDNGEFGTSIYADTSGKLYGSDFLVDWIEPTFEISLIGTTTDHFG